MSEFIHLDDSLLIAKGDNRKCFHHPFDSNRCIKVLLPDTPAKVNRREKRYFEHLNRRNISWDRLSRYYGTVATNLGQGLVFELLRDIDGSISKTLDHYLKLDNPELNDDIVSQIESLKCYLLQESILFRDLITLNLLLQQVDQHEFHLKIIDGIGHNDIIPLVNFSKTLANKKIKRIWNRKKSKWFDPYPSIRYRVSNYV